MENCFAVRLACFLADSLSAARHGALPFTEEFYRSCLKAVRATELAAETDDPELMTIYMKQCVHMMRQCGIIDGTGADLTVNRELIDGPGAFTLIFQSFWNDTPWDAIFPSMPEAAVDLQKNRNILRDLIAKQDDRFRLDDVSNEFFDLTGFSAVNDLLMISFLDFYYFTWLRHFGLVEYLRQKAFSPVVLRLTERGKGFLRTMR